MAITPTSFFLNLPSYIQLNICDRLSLADKLSVGLACHHFQALIVVLSKKTVKFSSKTHFDPRLFILFDQKLGKSLKTALSITPTKKTCKNVEAKGVNTPAWLEEIKPFKAHLELLDTGVIQLQPQKKSSFSRYIRLTEKELKSISALKWENLNSQKNFETCLMRIASRIATTDLGGQIKLAECNDFPARVVNEYNKPRKIMKEFIKKCEILDIFLNFDGDCIISTHQLALVTIPAINQAVNNTQKFSDAHMHDLVTTFAKSIKITQDHHSGAIIGIDFNPARKHQLLDSLKDPSTGLKPYIEEWFLKNSYYETLFKKYFFEDIWRSS